MHEDDFVDLSTARWLAVQLRYDVDCRPFPGMQTWWCDPRIRAYEAAMAQGGSESTESCESLAVSPDALGSPLRMEAMHGRPCRNVGLRQGSPSFRCHVTAPSPAADLDSDLALYSSGRMREPPWQFPPGSVLEGGCLVGASDVDALSQHVPLVASTATRPSPDTVANFCPRACGRVDTGPRLCSVTANGSDGVGLPSCVHRCRHVCQMRVHFGDDGTEQLNRRARFVNRCRGHLGGSEWPVVRPPAIATPPRRPATSTVATRSPGQVALLRAEAIKVYPEEVRAACHHGALSPRS